MLVEKRGLPAAEDSIVEAHIVQPKGVSWLTVCRC